ncbi:MAG: hypothetical protein ACYDHQ_05285 [Coriobacteriia bacterium]
MRILPDERPTPLSAGLDESSLTAPLVTPSPAAAGAALRAYGEELAQAGAAQTGGAFTDDPAADAFIKSAPGAFVIGVLFTQGIPAERAWAGPYLLANRLGHFDLARIASESDLVAAAVAAPPALHRFVKTLPGWIVSAARRITTEYAGDAAAIWPAGTPLAVVVERLRAFDGIGPKKAVMASEILLRHFGVELAGVECGSVAYDVHVRRVFLRTGLVEEDTPEAVSAAATRACPESPGVLDLASWLVGREYCHPREPRCAECRLHAACLRRVDRSAPGVGVRHSK